MNLRFHLSLLTLLLALLSVGRAAGWGDATEGRPVLEVFKPSEYHGGARVRCAAQDEAGRLYFGCEDGLVQYDGTTWRHFSFGNFVGVVALTIDQQGRIWIGGYEFLGYCTRTPTGDLQFTSLLPEVPRPYRDKFTIWGVEVVSRGVVFVASNLILRWDGKAFKVWPLAETRRSVCQKLGNAVYVVNQPTGMWKLEGDAPVLFVPRNQVNQQVPWLLKPLGGDSFLAVTTSSLGRIDGGKLTVLPADCEPYIRENFITTACILDDQTFAVGTYRGGVAIINQQGNIVRLITRADGLPDQAVNHLFVDREKNVWISTEGGIARMGSSGSVTMFDGANHLTGRSISSIAAHEGRLHVITGDGIFMLQARSDARSAANFALLPQPGLKLSNQSLLSRASGLLSSGFVGARLLKADGTLEEVYRSILDVWSLMESRHFPERVYFADPNGVGWLVEANGKWGSFPGRIPTSASASNLVEDSAGDLWIGTYKNAVLRVKFGADGQPANITQFQGGAELPANVGKVRVGLLHDRAILLTDAGILVADRPSAGFHPDAGMKGITTAQIHTFSNPDRLGNLWLAAEVPLADGSQRPVVGSLALDREGAPVWHALPINGLGQVGAINKLYYQEEAADRRLLWIGGETGLLRVKLDELQEPVGSFQCLVSAVRAPRTEGAAELPLSSAAPPRLPYVRNRVEFDYSAATYRDAELVRYQTRLEGFEDRWTPPSAKTFREFTNLSEGAYAFRVRAADGAGRWSEPATYHFVILPPWYRTPWAYALFALTIGSGIYGSFRLRLRQLRARTLQLEGLVRQRTEELARANAAKTDFVANMSHEIRNPLNGVIGLAGLMRQEAGTLRMRELAASLTKCAEYLSTLVEDVLDFAKIESGQVILDAAPFELRPVVEDVLAIFSWQAQERKMPLQLHWGEEVPAVVVGDAAKIKQIVINYVANAMKYAGAGPVEIGVASARVPAGAEITIEVRDQGPGIPAAEQATLFEKFSRTKQARAGNARGTGLGLAVCRVYAEKMGGAVGLRSSPGQGSVFWCRVALPVGVVTAPGSAPAAGPARPPILTRALIVEDQEYNVLVLDSMLTRMGYVTDQAGDGASALEKLQAGVYDIVFMDWELPDLSGVEVTRRFRQTEPPERHTLIVATTAYSSPEKRRECLAAGMDGFASKPLSPEKIKATIQNLSGPLRAGASIQVREMTPEPPDGKKSDLAVFRYMAGADPAKVRQLVEEFIVSLDKDVARLTEAVHAGHSEATRRQSHRILSQTALVSATRLAAVLARVQEASRRGDLESPRTMMTPFGAELEGLKQRLRMLAAE